MCGISCRTCKTLSASDGRVWAYSGSRRAQNAILTQRDSDSMCSRSGPLVGFLLLYLVMDLSEPEFGATTV